MYLYVRSRSFVLKVRRDTQRTQPRARELVCKIKFHISGINSRLAGAHGARFCATSRPIVFYLARFNGSLHRTRRKKIRKTTDMFCTLPQYFIGDSRIAPPSRRSPLFNSGIRPSLPLFLSIALSSFPSPALRSATTFSVVLHGIPWRKYSILFRVSPGYIRARAHTSLTLYELSSNPLIPWPFCPRWPKFGVPQRHARRD